MQLPKEAQFESSGPFAMPFTSYRITPVCDADRNPILDKDGKEIYTIVGTFINELDEISEENLSKIEQAVKLTRKLNKDGVRLQSFYQAPNFARLPKERETPMGFVYVMQNRRNGLFKIGFSKKPYFREKTLQSQEPEVEMIFSHKGSIELEKLIHGNFSRNRIRGEWFSLTEDELESVKLMLEGGEK